MTSEKPVDTTEVTFKPKENSPPPANPAFELRKRETRSNSVSSGGGDQSDFSDNQYKSHFYDSCAPPWASIFRAVLLLVIGTILTVIGSLLLAGYFDSTYADRTWPVLTLGLLCFIPGFYYSRIAFYAHRGYPGYSYLDIPSND